MDLGEWEAAIGREIEQFSRAPFFAEIARLSRPASVNHEVFR